MNKIKCKLTCQDQQPPAHRDIQRQEFSLQHQSHDNWTWAVHNQNFFVIQDVVQFLHHVNPFTLKISLVIFLTVCHTILLILVRITLPQLIIFYIPITCLFVIVLILLRGIISWSAMGINDANYTHHLSSDNQELTHNSMFHCVFCRLIMNKNQDRSCS